MKKVWHTPEFLFGIHWWTWKTTTKKLLKWANKNSKNFNIYNVVFFNISIFRMLCLFLKIKKKTWRYPNFAPAYQKSWWYDLHFLRYRVWQTEMKKNCWRYHHFTHVHQKPQSHEVQFLRYRVRQIELSVILGHFLHFYHLTTWTIKIWKNEKSISRCHHFSHVPTIMIIWRMLPEIWSATGIIFCNFGPFFALVPHYWPQKLTFGKNVKKAWRYYPFTNAYHKYRSYDIWFLRYKATTNRGFCHFGPCFALWPS